MKHLSRVVLIAAVTLLSMCLVACGSNSSNSNDAANNNAAETADASKDMKKVAVDQLKDDMQIIDTRTPDQFIGWKNSEGVSGHIPGAIDFPETWFDYEPDAKIIDIELERRHIDKTKPTVLYGNDDVTEDVYKKFADHGFEDLAVLEGGINDYDKKGEKRRH
ncbi:rhodanese-like domain-containing protein [Aedoeadaptatus pacaensis]|uniref:rhodanese-like domain-containing protein n=1 Tax=Aedoeadaptatus pacaensis TaxID=1776390 RepID=UPI000B32B40A|nr:rhodanese-like domain-containing protein [Peptoniphilus pacaensis]